MHPLNRKLFRDLWQMKGQALAIGLVIASGVAMFVMSLSTLHSLELTQNAYYQRSRFADVFANLKRAPQSLAARLAKVPGVLQVQTRIVQDVTLDVAGLPEPAVGRLISIPDRDQLLLNQLFLRSGQLLTSDLEGSRPGGVLTSEAFAQANGLQTGDSVTAVINGRKQRLLIVGIVLSPEYILQMRGSDVLPDPKRFGVFWMAQSELAAAFDMEGAFNDVSLTLTPGSSQAQVIQQIDALLEPYGCLGAYGRADQLSHRFLTDEIKQLRSMGFIAPLIFLSVAAFLLNVVLARLIDTQREQIAILKAFGYASWQVGLHYVKFVGVILAVGLGLGTVFGALLGRGLTRMYTQFYHFPVFHFDLDPKVVLFAMILCGVAGLLGTLFSVRRAAKLPAAEAMRPQPPATYRPTFAERFGFQRFFSQSATMVLRHLEREPGKALLACMGIALAVAVLILGSYMEDAIDFLIDYQFYVSQRQDMTVGFVEPTSGSCLYHLNQLPGVMYAEGFRSVPVHLRFDHRSRRLGIMGLEKHSRLFRLIDPYQKKVSLPKGGLVLSVKLGQLLGATVGDEILVQVQEGRRPTWRVPVAGLIADFSGTNAYMDLDTMHQLMREDDSLSGAFLTVDPASKNDLYRQLKNTPRIGQVAVREAMLESFDKTIAQNQLRMRLFNILFAVTIAFGVVYNTARVSLSKRGRDLATLRVIGLTRTDVSTILLGELAVLTLAAIPLGFGIGYGFAALSTWGFSTDLYRIPLVVERSTYAFSAIVVLVAAVCSGLVVRRKIDQFDLVSVLKAPE